MTYFNSNPSASMFLYFYNRSFEKVRTKLKSTRLIIIFPDYKMFLNKSFQKIFSSNIEQTKTQKVENLVLQK